MGRKKKDTIEAVVETTSNEKGTLLVDAKILDTVSKAFDKDFAMLLVGDTGTGKTSLVRQEAKKRGKHFTRINLNGQTDTADILGKWLIKDKETFWQDGLLTKAVREGHALLLDEINACPAEVLFALHGLLEDERYLVLVEKDGEIVKANDDFRIFATMNPSDGYEGTRELNRAFLSRFKIVLNLDYTDSEQEVLVNQYGMESGLASKLVQFAKETRATYKNQASDFLISTRDLINVDQLMSEGFDMEHAITLAIINKANPAETAALRQLSELVFGLKVQDYETGETIHDIKKIKESYDKMAKTAKHSTELSQTHDYLLTHSLHDILSEIRNGALLARKIIYRQSATVPTLNNPLHVNVLSNFNLGEMALPDVISIMGVIDGEIRIAWKADAKEYRGNLYALNMVSGNLRNYNHDLLTGKIGAEAWKKEVSEILDRTIAGSSSLDSFKPYARNFLEYVLTDNPPIATNTIEAVNIQ